MRRIATIFATCMLVALAGTAVAVASSGRSGGNDDSTTGTTNTTATTTTPTTTTPTNGALQRSRNLLGRVTALDAATKKVTVVIQRRNGGLRRGTRVTVATTDNTRYKGVANGFAGLVVGKSYKLKVRRLADGSLVALRIERKRAHRRSGDDNRRSDDDRGGDRRSGSDDGADHDAGDDNGGRSGNSGSGRGRSNDD